MASEQIGSLDKSKLNITSSSSAMRIPAQLLNTNYQSKGTLSDCCRSHCPNDRQQYTRKYNPDTRGH